MHNHRFSFSLMNEQLCPGMNIIREQLGDLTEIVKELFWVLIDLQQVYLMRDIKLTMLTTWTILNHKLSLVCIGASLFGVA